MNKNITTLRNHLFDQLNRLADASEREIDLETKKAIQIVAVAEIMIKTVEVENQFIAITKGTGSGFVPLVDGQVQQSIIDAPILFEHSKKDPITGIE